MTYDQDRTSAGAADAPIAASSGIAPAGSAEVQYERYFGPMPLAYTDPGRHKRGTNPCFPRNLRRAHRREARRKKDAWGSFLRWADEVTSMSDLTEEQRGNAWQRA